MKKEASMKKRQAILIVSIVLVTGIALFAVAFADADRGLNGRGFGKHRQHKGFALALLARYQVKNLAAQTLSEMSGQSVEKINQKLENQRPRSVVQELDIDHEAFQNAMQGKIRGLVRQAAENGSITPDQEKTILAKMEDQAQRRTLNEN